MNQLRASPFLNSVPVLGYLLWGRVHRLPCRGRCRWLERQEPESTSQSRRKPRGTKSSRAAVLQSFSHRAWDLRVRNSLRSLSHPPTPQPTPALTHHLHPIASISSTEQKPQCWPPLQGLAHLPPPFITKAPCCCLWSRTLIPPTASVTSTP